jgi:hypothetical protein
LSWMILAPDFASQICAVPSAKPVTMRKPSGDHASNHFQRIALRGNRTPHTMGEPPPAGRA